MLMRVEVYKAKRDPLKRISLELPDVHCVYSSCRTTHVTEVPLKNYMYECADCIPPCVGKTRHKSSIRKLTSTECKDSSTDFCCGKPYYVPPSGNCKRLV